MDVIEHILAEYNKVTKKFGKFNTTHEGIAIIREEYLELEKEVFWGKDNIKLAEEAIQVAAMAIRFLVDCCGLELRKK